MKYFSMPADFKQETIDHYADINKRYKDSRVMETYGNITQGTNFGSGRVVNQIPQIDLLDLQQYIDYSKKFDINFNYTLNITYLQNREFTEEGIQEIARFLGKLHRCGVRSLTVSMPSLLVLIQKLPYNFEIKASTMCHIDNPTKARTFKRLGVKRIVVDESMHRDFKALKQTCDVFGPEVEVIANTMCHMNCIYRLFHNNQAGGDSVKLKTPVAVNFYEHYCLLQRYDTLGDILKLGWIRPEDLHYYTGTGIRYFKLQGRQHVSKGGHLRTLQHYIDGSFDGNLLEMLDMFNFRYSFKLFIDNKKLDGFIKPFYEKEGFCDLDCSQCHYCDAYAKKHLDSPHNRETLRLAKEFYSGYDEYKKIIERAKTQTAAPSPQHREEIEETAVPSTRYSSHQEVAIDFELD